MLRKRLFAVFVACTGATVLACAGGSGSSSTMVTVPMSPVVDCDSVDREYEQSRVIFNALFLEPSVLILDDAGMPHRKLVATALSNGFDGGVPDGVFADGDGGTAPSQLSLRHRAAVFCACRAQHNRALARADGTLSDVLTGIGAIGAVGGGAVGAVAAGINGDESRQRLLSASVITSAAGAAAFGLNAALNESKRATDHNTSAEVQEVAAAMLWNDFSDSKSWSTAWTVCAASESASSAGRLDNPQQVIPEYIPDAGAPASKVDAAADPAATPVTMNEAGSATADIVNNAPTTH